jgi:hypothetical protein
MLPNIPPQQKRSSALERLGFGGDWADSSISPDLVAAALRGGLTSSLPYQTLNLRSPLMSHDVGSRSAHADLIAALMGRDSLRDTLLAHHGRHLVNPMDSLAVGAGVGPHMSLGDSVHQHDDIVQEAFQRGREEAMLSLVRSGALDASMLQHQQRAPSQLNHARSMFEHLSQASAPQARDNFPSGALGGAGIERKKKNSPYFDASSMEDPDAATLANRRTRGGVTEPFPEKLGRLLRETEERGEADVVSFFPHGRAFAIHHVERFCREVMPRYFKQSRLSSFQRQLNLYGFTRITSGPDTGGYYHELFLKGRPALVIHMRRVGVPKPSGNIRSSRPMHSAAAPDFYSMNPVLGGDEEEEKE